MATAAAAAAAAGKTGAVDAPGQVRSLKAEAKRPSTAVFLILSLVFHLLYTTSIFDIYFTSPVVHPARRFSRNDTYIGDSAYFAQSAPPPDAKRLVLIVGDGLRADTLFKEHSPQLWPPWAKERKSSESEEGEVEDDEEGSFVGSLYYKKDWSKAQLGSEPTKTEPFYAAPHLRDIALERGAWGISHTRVPTESRPGHVALIAGMYEDVSAVTKGWKLNPVSFDSLFNQSTHTFSFGSPDILPMFAQGASPRDKVDVSTYDESAEDFTADASDLDLWVLDRLTELLDEARENKTLSSQLRAPGTVFFLHLLGLDTTGHTYRPHSSEYVGNLMVVDSIVQRVETLMTDFFEEDDGEESKTAYVFTADHGMSNKGNHGDGEPDNTRTPLVAWGAGVRGPALVEGDEQAWRAEQKEKDAYFRSWGEDLDGIWREDVRQADITPLMATLLNVPMPANSEGILPLNYLEASDEVGVRASLANAMEILEMYRVKDEYRRKRMLRYVPFPEFPTAPSGKLPGEVEVTRIKHLINLDQLPKALRQIRQLVDVSLRGATYLQTYDWLLLVAVVSTGYLGSMIYGIIFLLHRYVLKDQALAQLPARSGPLGLGNILAVPVGATFTAKFVAEEAPLTYYLYVAFAIFFWARIINQRQVIVIAFRSALDSKDVDDKGSPAASLFISIAQRLILALAALELMAYGYLERLAWSFGFAMLALAWPALFMDAEVRTRHEGLLLLWTLCCIVTGHFTIGGVDKEESVVLLVLSGVIFFTAGVTIVAFPSNFFSRNGGSGNLSRTLNVLKGQLLVLVVSTIVTASSSRELQAKRGLPLLNQIIAWLILFVCLTVPFAYGFSASSAINVRKSPSQRMAIIVFAFAPVFVLLSIRDEALFFGSYVLTLLIWAKLEASLYEERLVAKRTAEGKVDALTSRVFDRRKLEKEDVRLALTFLFMLHFGFFGTGNVASISSFYLSPVYRLVPVFSPFLMAALLLLKILVPFILLGSVMQLLCLSPPHPRASMQAIPAVKTGKYLGGPPLLGDGAVGGLGLEGDGFPPVLLACIAADVLALNFLFSVSTEGSWLEIGRTITHFVMANMLQVFMLAIAAGAKRVVGGSPSHSTEAVRKDT
ncbi:alkaline phosphatase-like protein [Acaromyces ingoldii]|uniref:GPI ethanolamine phosphate transferase 1 n=1 Tax=Acaromyces ingoldii TaxID=215250 RepID=A0A316YK76_9BASI|nr:alkaline phosphatase-like protein [Acaromyces ingoldii]PWN89476.1 alkaline phosphatase-like protein [Acaromyces ingoldii]